MSGKKSKKVMRTEEQMHVRTYGVPPFVRDALSLKMVSICS